MDFFSGVMIGLLIVFSVSVGQYGRGEISGCLRSACIA